MTSPVIPDSGAAGSTDLAVADLAELGRVEVRGEDRVELLHRILACAVTDLAPGSVRPGSLLSAQGRVRALFLLGAGESAHHLEVEARFAPGLAAALEAFRFGERAEIEDASGRSRAIGLLGAGAARALVSLGAGDPPAPGRFTRFASSGREIEAARVDALAEPLFLLRAPAQVATGLVERLLASTPGSRALDASEVEALRIEIGVPRYGVDVGESEYPHDVSMEGALSVTKGCYPGQEVAARLTTYQGFHRRRVGLVLDGSETPAAEDPVQDDGGGEVGRVTSAAFSGRLRRPIAMASVRKEAATPGTRLRVTRGGRSLAALVVPFPLSSAPGDAPQRGA